jgi:hypothetical protein
MVAILQDAYQSTYFTGMIKFWAKEINFQTKLGIKISLTMEFISTSVAFRIWFYIGFRKNAY